MTSPVIKTYDCVTDSTTTSGTGTVTLAGVAAQSGTRAVSAAATTGDIVAYKLVDGSAQEVGFGTLTSGTNWTLTRNLLYSSTGSLLALSGGTTQVWLDAPAALLLSVFQQGVQGVSSIAAAGTTQGGATQIVSPLTVITSSASGAGVVLPAPPTNSGSPLYFIDNSSSLYSTQLYPSSGCTIDGLAANTAITLAPGAYWLGFAESSAGWQTFAGNIIGTANQVAVSYVNGGVQLALLAGVRNYINNGCARIAQRGSTGYGSANTPIYGQCDRWLVGSAGATTQTAGTIVQGSLSGTASGYSIKAAGFTLTGSGSTVVFKHRIEAKNAADLNGQTIIAQALVAHGVGSNINYTIAINKPTSTADTFSSVTNIATSGNISVPTGTSAGTQISFSTTLSSAQASLGLEIVITAVCGAVTATDFHVANCGLYLSALPQNFQMGDYTDELLLCRRYFVGFPSMVNGNNVCFGGAFSTTQSFHVLPLQTSMRKAPTGITISAASDFGVSVAAGTITACTALAFNASDIDSISFTGTVSSGLVTGNASALATKTANATLAITGAEL